MAKIDRLGWVDGLSFTAYGVRVGVRVNDAQFMRQLQEYFPPGWKPASSLVVERLYSLILKDGETRLRVEFATARGGSGAAQSIRSCGRGRLNSFCDILTT
jgi:hypothetical protein